MLKLKKNPFYGEPDTMVKTVRVWDADVLEPEIRRQIGCL